MVGHEHGSPVSLRESALMETPAEYITARGDSGSAAGVGELLGVGEGGVPRTLLNQAPARVIIMALMGSGVYTAHIGMSLYLHPAYMPMPTDRTLPIAAWLAFVLISGLVCLVAWRRWVRRELLLDLALCYEVVGAFFIAFTEQLLAWPELYSVRGISWICRHRYELVSASGVHADADRSHAADRSLARFCVDQRSGVLGGLASVGSAGAPVGPRALL